MGVYNSGNDMQVDVVRKEDNFDFEYIYIDSFFLHLIVDKRLFYTTMTLFCKSLKCLKQCVKIFY